MSGNPEKHRVIISGRLVSPIACCRDFNAKAIAFKRSINGSLSTARLQADIAVKSLGVDMQRKQDPADTDNKKREFTGDTMPGVEKNGLGYRWRPEAKGGDKMKLVLTPSFISKRGLDTGPNFGWIKEEEEKKETFQDLLNNIKKRPQIRFSKFDVNPRTGDVDQSTEKVVDPFATAAGMTAEERKRALNQGKAFEEKSLGRTLGKLVPGGSLVARAAAAIGVLRDENNKFRCPPGTPAANQFTDAAGSNCFGFSPSRFARFAAEQAQRLTDQGEMDGLRNNARNVLDFLYTGRMFRKWAEKDPARAGRSPWYDAVTGERIETPNWRDIDGPENLRLTQNGMVNAQAELQRADARVRSLQESLGVDVSDAARAENKDLDETFEKLRQLAESGDPSGWDVMLVDKTGERVGRWQPAIVDAFVRARLEAVPGWNNLTKEEQDVLVKADTARYYETERAFLESLLDEFVKNPESARMIGQIIHDPNNPEQHEAGTSFYQQGKGGPMRSSIDYNLNVIMENQESMLPGLSPNERLSISVVGGRTDAERQRHLAHFMLNADYAARQMAGMVDGPRSFTRHIGKHEFSHVLQGRAFLNALQAKIDAGTLEFPKFDKAGNFLGMEKVTDIRQIDSRRLLSMMKKMGDDVDLEELGQVMSRLEGVVQFAGTYPNVYLVKPEERELWALEACAELWAMRDAGLIHGDDVDSVLAWMDDVTARDAETSAAIARRRAGEMDDSPVSPGEAGPAPNLSDEEVAQMADDARLRRLEQRREAFEAFKTEFEELREDEMFDAAAAIATEFELTQQRIKDVSEIQPDESLSEAEKEVFEETRAQALELLNEALELHQEKYNHAQRAWAKKYSLNPRLSRDERIEFDNEVRRIRAEAGMLSGQEMEIAARESEMRELIESVDRLSEKQIVQRIADRQILMRHAGNDTDEAIRAAEEIDAIREAYIDKLKAAGDTRSRAKISRDLDAKVEALISPKPKPTRKFKSKADAKEFAKKKRARQSRKLTKEQRRAVKEMDGFTGSELNDMLDPAKQVSTGRAINRRNARLKKNGLPIDTSSAEEAALEEQVKNILIPAMEAIDASVIDEPIDIEAIIDVDPKSVSGKSIGKEFEIDGFVDGRLMPRGTRPTKLTRAEERDAPEGKKKKRVIISLREGDRALFTKTDEDGNERVVIPPGMLRVVSRDEDGTIRLEVSRQKDTVEVVESLRDSLGSDRGDDAIWRKGAHRKVKTVVDNYVAEKHSRGGRTGPRTDDEQNIADANTSVVGEVVDTGSSFGEGIDDSDIQPPRPPVTPPPSRPRPPATPPGGGTPSTPPKPTAPAASGRIPTGWKPKSRRSKVHEQIAGDTLVGVRRPSTDTRFSLEDEADFINRQVHGPEEWNVVRIVPEIGRMVGQITGDTERQLKDLTGDELLELRALIKARAEQLSRSPDQYNKSRAQSISRFASRIDDLIDIRYEQENGPGSLRAALDEQDRLSIFTDSPGGRRPPRGPYLGGGPDLPGSLSSGKPSSLRQRPEVKPVTRNLSDGSLLMKPRVGVLGKRDGKLIGQPSRNERFQFHEFREWSIGDEKVIFGIPRLPESMSSDPGYYDGDANIVPINPYVISGLLPESDEGREIAKKWANARAYAQRPGSKSEKTEVEALLYAGMRGDTQAMQRFEEMASAGEALVKELKDKRKQELLDAYNSPDVQQMLKDARLDDVSVNDLFIVHETRFRPEFDENGNVILRPLGDYLLQSTTGQNVTYDRDTIHFALNHLAGGHLERPRAEDGEERFIIISKLSDVIDTNPGSVDALQTVDTSLIPKPGEPLRLPSGSTRVISNPAADMADRDVQSALREMGARHIFTPGDYGDRVENASLIKIATEIDANPAIHVDTPASRLEKRDPGDELSGAVESPQTLSLMSENGILRLGNNETANGLSPSGYSMDRGEYEGWLARNDGRPPSVSELDDEIDSLSSGRSLYSPKQTRTQRTQSRRKNISNNAGEIRKILSGKGSKEFPELSRDSIDPRVAELIMNLPDEELHKRVENAAYRFHHGLDRRARVRMRENELDDMFITGMVRSPLSENDGSDIAPRRIERAIRSAAEANGLGDSDVNYGEIISSPSLSSGAVRSAIASRLNGTAVSEIADRMGLDEGQREVLELITETAANMKMGGPKVALTRLAVELARRGSRDLTEFTLDKLVQDGRITERQARAIMKKVDKVAPKGLPEPIKDAAVSAGRAARRVADSPETRRRVEGMVEGVSGRAGRVGESGREGMRRVRERFGRARDSVGGGSSGGDTEYTIDAFGDVVPVSRGSSPRPSRFDTNPTNDPFAGYEPEPLPARRDPFGGSSSLSSGRRNTPEDNDEVITDRFGTPLSGEEAERVKRPRAERAAEEERKNEERKLRDIEDKAKAEAERIAEENTSPFKPPSKLRDKLDYGPKIVETGDIKAAKIDTSKTDDDGSFSGIDRDLPSASIENSKPVARIQSKPHITLSTDRDSDAKRAEPQEYEAEIYNIGGKKIAFGFTGNTFSEPVDWGDSPVGEVEMYSHNPFEISGYDPASERGQELAWLWYLANLHQGHIVGEIHGDRYTGGDDTLENGVSYIDALLYAASRGDSESMSKLQELAKKGQKLRDDAISSERDVANNVVEMAEKGGIKPKKLAKKDVILVHQTEYELEFNEDGDLLLRPLGDFDTPGEMDNSGMPGIGFQPKDGGRMINNEMRRPTIHFAVNELAAPVSGRGRPQTSQIVLFSLEDAIDANPDSVNSLYEKDTTLSPLPGTPLRIPAGKFKVIKRDEGREYETSVDDDVAEAISELGGAARETEDKKYYEFVAGLQRLAGELGVSFDMDRGSPAQAIGVGDGAGGKHSSVEESAELLAATSKNAILRLINTRKKSRKKYDELIKKMKRQTESVM